MGRRRKHKQDTKSASDKEKQCNISTENRIGQSSKNRQSMKKGRRERPVSWSHTHSATSETAQIPHQKGSRHKKCKSPPHASSSSSGTQASSSASSSSQSDDTLEIPGFYYDPEKKKYFKILPSQNVNAGAVTKQSIKEKNMEMVRKERVQEFLENKSKRHVQNSITARYKSSKTLDLIDRRRLGQIDTNLYREKYLLHRAAHLRPCGSVKLFAGSSSGYDKIEHFRQMLPDSECSKLLCLWTLKDTMTQRIQIMKMNSLRKTDEEGTLTTQLSTEGKIKLQHTTKVTHMTWAEQSNGENPELQALFTSSCFLGCNPSTAYLFKLNPQQPQQQSSGSQIINPATEMFMLGPQAAWTCAWSRSRAQFSVGTEHCSMLLDVTTRRLWELHTKGQSVHTQAFAPETGHLLYSGTRKGCVCCHDLRSISTRFTYCLNHRTSISHLLPLQDTNYLLASDFSGKILKWDLRKRSVVNTFHGQNEYSHLPFHLDPSGTVLYSAGQDCYTRLWNFRTGELLSTIPPPFPASREVIPALCLSLGIGKSPETPALLLGMKDTMHFYA